MRIDEEQVRYVAELANLNLTAEETARTAREMSDILTHIDKLNEALIFQQSEIDKLRQSLTRLEASLDELPLPPSDPAADRPPHY